MAKALVGVIDEWRRDRHWRGAGAAQGTLNLMTRLNAAGAWPNQLLVATKPIWRGNHGWRRGG